MASTATSIPVVVESSLGPFIAGTRITLYDVMDYLTQNWPPNLIKHWLKLTDEQITGAMDYIQAHRAELEKEYETVLKQSEENRRYWEERNKARFAEIAARPPKPGKERIRAKLQAWKARLAQNGEDPCRP